MSLVFYSPTCFTSWTLSQSEMDFSFCSSSVLSFSSCRLQPWVATVCLCRPQYLSSSYLLQWKYLQTPKKEWQFIAFSRLRTLHCQRYFPWIPEICGFFFPPFPLDFPSPFIVMIVGLYSVFMSQHKKHLTSHLFRHPRIILTFLVQAALATYIKLLVFPRSK